MLQKLNQMELYQMETSLAGWEEMADLDLPKEEIVEEREIDTTEFVPLRWFVDVDDTCWTTTAASQIQVAMYTGRAEACAQHTRE